MPRGRIRRAPQRPGVRIRVLDGSRTLADAYDARLTTRHRQSIAYRLAPDHRLLEVHVAPA